MNNQPTARRCEICGQPKAVTFHAAEVDGRMRSVRAHVPCFNRWRAAGAQASALKSAEAARTAQDAAGEPAKAEAAPAPAMAAGAKPTAAEARAAVHAAEGECHMASIRFDRARPGQDTIEAIARCERLRAVLAEAHAALRAAEEAEAAAPLEAVRDSLRKIEALTGNPHWTMERRWRIGELAQDARQRIDAILTAQEGGNHGR